MIEVGATIAGKYRVERILGRGGMGYVVQAFHEQLAESVAIKFMVPELAITPDAPARFLREARAAFRIKSEHVARVLDVGEHAGAPFIVMELLSGHDLATEIAERFVPSSDAVGYMLQICEALASAHSLGIVHRDLKPSNLFLTRRPDGTALIKVLDFGISKALDDPNLAPADSLTLSHRLLGSPHYMSPEQARAPKSADARSDIWSLGIVLYELVLGERPFRGETAVAILAALLNDPLPEVSAEQRRKMPDDLMRVIRR
ncbi:MAG TPA: serine/threonine-protein kinase, partial [Polyangiaceae bacterium]